MRLAAAALVVAASAAAQDAGTDVPTAEVVSVSRATLRLEDGGVRLVQSGAWLSDPQLIRTAQELVSLRTEVRELRKTPPAPPEALVVAIALGAVGGLAAGIILGVTVLPR